VKREAVAKQARRKEKEYFFTESGSSKKWIEL